MSVERGEVVEGDLLSQVRSESWCAVEKESGGLRFLQAMGIQSARSILSLGTIEVKRMYLNSYGIVECGSALWA